jgi:hypothetical protein
VPEPILPLFTDPAGHSPDERARAVAAILAAGLLRLNRPVIPPEPLPTAAPQKSPESLANHLAVPAEQSVTVHAG